MEMLQAIIRKFRVKRIFRNTKWAIQDSHAKKNGSLFWNNYKAKCVNEAKCCSFKQIVYFELHVYGSEIIIPEKFYFE